MNKRKHNRSPFRWFTTYFVFFSYLIVGLEMFNAGTDVHHRYWSDLTFDIIIAVFWAGIGIMMARMAYKDGKLDGDIEGLEKMGELLDMIAQHEAAELARKVGTPAKKVEVKDAK